MQCSFIQTYCYGSGYSHSHSHVQLHPSLTHLSQSHRRGGLAFPSSSLSISTAAAKKTSAGRKGRTNNNNRRQDKRQQPQSELEPESELLPEGEEYVEHDAEAADILMGSIDDPEKMRKKVEDRIKKKQKQIFQPKTGSAEAMNVIFNNFEFSDFCVWIEFERAPEDKELALISGAMRSWYMLGHLGGYNSMNLQLTKLPIDKQPTYDCAQATKVAFDGVAFENIGDIEIQDNLARVWVDIGNSDQLVLDVLINALKSLSSDYIGIKQLVFGGTHWGNWEEEKTSPKDGYRVWTI